jgi:DNA-binding transcriptional ArsR family regulator
MFFRSAHRLPLNPSSPPLSIPDPQAAAHSMPELEHKKFALLAQTFQALGDSSRVRIVWHLSKKEYKVGELAQVLSMSQPAVSHHLRILRQLHLVKVRRDGRISFYSLDDLHIDRLLQEGLEHVEELL